MISAGNLSLYFRSLNCLRLFKQALVFHSYEGPHEGQVLRLDVRVRCWGSVLGLGARVRC